MNCLFFVIFRWRSCWVRYGYDPRTIHDSRMYQMIDYRLRYLASEPSSTSDQIVKAKPRSIYHNARKFRNDQNDSNGDGDGDGDGDEVEGEKSNNIDDYKFKPDKLPISRNVYYQVCDIEDDDVQALLNSRQIQSNYCSEKEGWYTKNFQDQCRDIMNKKHEIIAKQLTTQMKEINKNKTN
jgi:general transcription factor 3C polypeptide 5 (transcription factor C subunit 1)